MLKASDSFFPLNIVQGGGREVLVMKMRKKLESFKEFHLFMAMIAAHLVEISLYFAGISARRDEIFPYEQSIPVRWDGKFLSVRMRESKNSQLL